MKRTLCLIVFLIMVGLLLSGCASLSDVIANKDRGTVQAYPIPSDKAWDVAMTVLHWEGAGAIEEHRSEGYMLSSTSMNMVSMGCHIGVWVEAIDSGNSKITCVTKRKVATNAATGMTEATFHKKFAQAVEIVKSGQPLPAKAP